MSSPYRSQLTIMRALTLAKQTLPTGPFWDNGLNFLSAWNRLRYIPRLDLPRSFNEHILRQKRNFQKNLNLASRITDKYYLKEWLESLGYHDLAVPTLGVYTDARELDGRLIEKNSILKPTHLSGTVIPVYTPRTLTGPELGTASRWLKTDYYRRSREIVYRNLQKRIIKEELMLDENGNIPMDYKFFCFHGQPFLIQVDLGRFAKHTRQLYSPTWDLHDFGMKFPRNPDPIAMPRQLDRALTIASDLSCHFSFCRVDFYFLREDEIRVGELTFFPGSGGERFTPRDADFQLGAQMRSMVKESPRIG